MEFALALAVASYFFVAKAGPVDPRGGAVDRGNVDRGAMLDSSSSLFTGREEAWREMCRIDAPVYGLYKLTAAVVALPPGERLVRVEEMLIMQHKLMRLSRASGAVLTLELAQSGNVHFQTQAQHEAWRWRHAHQHRTARPPLTVVEDSAARWDFVAVSHITLGELLAYLNYLSTAGRLAVWKPSSRNCFTFVGETQLALLDLPGAEQPRRR